METTTIQAVSENRRTIRSKDSFSAGYVNKRQWVREEHWYDVHPYSLAIWPHCFTDNIRRGEWWIRRGNYASIALELQLEGETCYRVDGKTETLTPGELFITLPGCDVSMHNGPLQFGRQYQLIISGGMVKLLVESLGLRECRKLQFPGETELEAVKARFLRLAELMEHKIYAEAAENSHLGYEFIAFLAGKYSQAEKQELPPLLTRAIWTMEADRRCNLSVGELARELGTSRATLTRMFQIYLNTSPHAYWNNLRMESAKQLVAAGQLSFKEIAENLGFRNSLYFSTAFRTYTGLTPTEFKRKGETPSPA
ncbi:MAG: helix-turn-helix transcriptional regulator [Lentisphaeria bacterium]|nr:helix-turn-helix transcriptional regulator [Lentisphaeria bacterium]